MRNNLLRSYAIIARIALCISPEQVESIPRKAQSRHQTANGDHINCSGPAHLLAIDLVQITFFNM